MTNVNRTTIAEYFGRLDELVAAGTELYIYGGAAVAALGADIRTTMDEIREAVDRLPPTFRDDPLVRENLDNLATDRTIWGIA